MSENLTDAKKMSPLALAFYGDSVYSLLARKHLVGLGARPVGQLHQMCADLVCAKTQAEGAAAITEMLSEEETAVFKRGRNAHVSHTPKGATDAQYHAATALEALFGWLALNGEMARAQELFDAIISKL